MAPRGTTRSQKPLKASQSQPAHTQRSHKHRRAETPEEDDDDGDEENRMDVDDEENEEQTHLRTKNGWHTSWSVWPYSTNTDACISAETTSRRKAILTGNSRAFSRVFAEAQSILRNLMGMELVELRTRAELDPDKEKPAEGEEARNAAGVKRKAAAAGSKTYILRSTLSPQLIEAMAATDEDILEVEAEDAPSEDDEDDEYTAKSYGNMLAWSKADQLAPLGILYVILALILVSGRVVGDQDLRAMLKRLNLSSTTPIPFTAASTHPGNTLTLDAYLTQLMRQGYIDRAQVGSGPGIDGKKTANKGKRGRVSAADDESGTSYEWRWGPRAASEVGEQAIGTFVAEFMVSAQFAGAEDDDDAEEGNAAARARAKKKQADAKARMEKMLNGVARAAGGGLAEIK
ncbi:MAGE domain-containing protein [Mycena chlorophos]|uniref:MAGE domain-containing protein n=1 Tax=Mycena chlorophos TaxID=658473 RepID=A0A8H6SKT7_MYCCL|nr:MAGE domain-containing protein [Mycena chlorophos]